MRLVQPVLIVVCTLGCGKSEKQLASHRRSAQQAFDAGVVAFENRDFAVAEQELTSALEFGGLYGDLVDTARATRAVSVAAQGNFEAAHAFLNEMEQSTLEKDILYAARSYVLYKQGKKKAAKAAWSKARRVNRYVKRFK